MELAELVDPGHTVLVTQECQNGVIGDAAVLRELAEEAHRTAVPNIARLAGAARAAGVPVVHCLAVRRADDKGSNANARLFSATRKLGIRLEPGSPEAEVIPQIDVQPDDLVLQRFHGIGPMGGTDLDAVRAQPRRHHHRRRRRVRERRHHQLRDGRGESRLPVRTPT